MGNQLETKKIKYYVKNIYGTDRFYVNDPREARNFQQLTQTETLSVTHMKAFEELTGIEFQETLPHREMPM